MALKIQYDEGAPILSSDFIISVMRGAPKLIFSTNEVLMSTTELKKKLQRSAHFRDTSLFH